MSVSSSSAQLIVDPRPSFVTPQISRQYGPFYDADSFKYSMEFLEIASVRQVARVCKLWNRTLEAPHVWKKMIEIEGIPFVESEPFIIKLNDEVILTYKEPRNHKTDLKALYPITTSGWQISQTLGRPVGKTPAIAEKWFLMLQKEDPFEPGKLMGETFKFVCTYSRVTRILDEKTPLILDEFGTLKVVPKEASDGSCSSSSAKPSFVKRIISFAQSTFGQNASSTTKPQFAENPMPTEIGLSLKNQRALSLHPSIGQENTPVFNKDSYELVFEQCDGCVPRNGVYFMRKHVAEESRNKAFTAQEALVKAKGLLIGAQELGITPLAVRALDSAVSILRKGTCPDGREPWTYARSSNALFVGNQRYQAGSGGFARGSGLVVHFDYFGYDDVAVAPGGPAEVLELGH